MSGTAIAAILILIGAALVYWALVGFGVLKVETT